MAKRSAAGVPDKDGELWKHCQYMFLKVPGDYGAALAAVKRLLAEGANPNVRGTQERSALHHLAYYGPAEVVAVLLEAGADPGLKDRYGATALHQAASGGNPEIARMLLDRGAGVDAVGLGYTPLHAAAEQGREEVASLLLEWGASVTPEGAAPPLEAAARSGHHKVVALLRAKGAPLSEKVLLAACCGGLADLVADCLDAGFSPDVHGFASTPLTNAADYGRVEVVKLLLDRGADQNLSDDRKSPILAAAASSFNGGAEILRVLIEAGASLATGPGGTPLHAAMRQNEELQKAQILLAHGVDPRARDAQNRTAAMISRDPAVRKLIKAAIGGAAASLTRRRAKETRR